MSSFSGQLLKSQIRYFHLLLAIVCLKIMSFFWYVQSSGASKHLGRIYMLIWGLPFICCYLQFSFVDSSVPSTPIHQFQTCSTYLLFPYSEYNLFLLLNYLVIVRLLSELSFFSVSNWVHSFLWDLQMVQLVSNIYFSIFI